MATATARYASSSVRPAAAFALGASRPNPAAGRASIDNSVASGSHVTIHVFDAAGRLIRTLVDGPAEAGPHQVVWDGTNNDGRPAGSGEFFYRMNAGAWQSQKKMIVMRNE